MSIIVSCLMPKIIFNKKENLQWTFPYKNYKKISLNYKKMNKNKDN